MSTCEDLSETGLVLICFEMSQGSRTVSQAPDLQPCGPPTAGGAQVVSWRWRRLGRSPGLLPAPVTGRPHVWARPPWQPGPVTWSRVRGPAAALVNSEQLLVFS